MSNEKSSKEIEAFYEIKIEWNDQTTSFNKNKTITLVSKTEDCKELMDIAIRSFDELREEFDEDEFTDDELRMMRIQFISQMGN